MSLTNNFIRTVRSTDLLCCKVEHLSKYVHAENNEKSTISFRLNGTAH